MAIGLSKRTTDLDGSTVIARTGVAVQTGTQAEHDLYTGELGEVTYNTTDNRPHWHDGVTAGGFPMAREDTATADALIAKPIGGEFTLAAGLATVASAGAAVKLVAVTAAKGASNGFLVATDQKLTPTFSGTRLVRIRGRLLVDVATGTDNVTIHVFNELSSIFETAAQAVTAASPKLFEFDFLYNLDGDAATFGLEIFAENEDTTENVDTIVAAERADTTPEHGFFQITAA